MDEVGWMRFGFGLVWSGLVWPMYRWAHKQTVNHSYNKFLFARFYTLNCWRLYQVVNNTLVTSSPSDWLRLLYLHLDRSVWDRLYNTDLRISREVSISIFWSYIQWSIFRLFYFISFYLIIYYIIIKTNNGRSHTVNKKNKEREPKLYSTPTTATSSASQTRTAGTR